MASEDRRVEQLAALLEELRTIQRRHDEAIAKVEQLLRQLGVSQ